MRDCPNAEVRDLLPDLMHDRLDAPTRASVVAHLEGCADCQAELELMQMLRALLTAPSSRFDAEAVIAGVEKRLEHAPAASPVRPRVGRSGRPWSDWRIAAAMTLLVGGASSVLVVHRPDPADVQAVASQIDTALHGQSATESTGGSPQDSGAGKASPGARNVTGDPGATAGGLGLSGRLADLDDGQLEALLQDINELQAVPITEPDPVTITIDPSVGDGIGAPDGNSGNSGNNGNNGGDAGDGSSSDPGRD